MLYISKQHTSTQMAGTAEKGKRLTKRGNLLPKCLPKDMLLLSQKTH